MNVETEIALVGEGRLSCVDAHADCGLEFARPLVEPERPLCRDGCPHSILGALEPAEKLVSATVDFDPARLVHGDSKQMAVIA
jgi:hypothetical protein